MNSPSTIHTESTAKKSRTIPVYKPYLSGKEKEYVNHCLDTTWISSKGEYITQFEQAFAQYINTPYATSVCNGTVAVHLALLALGIGPGDEVIVPTLTYVATVNTIIQTGATPIFVDSLASTWQIDPEDIKRKITPATKAIMAVHLYGLPCAMDEIVKICHDYQILLIEDCAEAFGTWYKNQYVGTFGDIATFSFFGNKTITTGEGGMVVTKNKEILEKAYHLKNQGVSPWREYWHDTLAYNYRMTNICAAIGLAQLEQADIIIAKKRLIADWYAEELSGLPLRMHREIADTRHSYWMCSILLDEATHREPLRSYLKQAGIETRPLFPPVHELPHCKIEACFPIAESLSARGINLPSYPDLSLEDVNYICQQIKQYFAA